MHSNALKQQSIFQFKSDVKASISDILKGSSAKEEVLRLILELVVDSENQLPLDKLREHWKDPATKTQV